MSGTCKFQQGWYRTMRIFMLALLLMSLTAAVRAATYEQAEALYKNKKFAEARQAYLQYAQENSVSTATVSAKFKAAQCLFDQTLYKDFQPEGEGLVKQNPNAEKAALRHME